MGIFVMGLSVDAIVLFTLLLVVLKELVYTFVISIFVKRTFSDPAFDKYSSFQRSFIGYVVTSIPIIILIFMSLAALTKFGG